MHFLKTFFRWIVFTQRFEYCLSAFVSLLRISGTLTVNVSVLLLSLASPDESSLVSIPHLCTWKCVCVCVSGARMWCIYLTKKTRFHHRVNVIEIRGGVPAAATMVRSAFALSQSLAVRVPERHPPSREHMAARHVFHHARRLQGADCTDAFCAAHLSQRHDQLLDEVRRAARA